MQCETCRYWNHFAGRLGDCLHPENDAEYRLDDHECDIGKYEPADNGEGDNSGGE